MSQQQSQGEHQRQSSGQMSGSAYDVKNLHVQSVVVYTDRAEVRRTFKCSVKGGQNEITVYNLPGAIDPDSIRVEGRGNAAITEVTYLTKKEEREGEQEDNAVQKQIRDLVKHIRSLEAERRRAKKRQEIIKGLGDQLTPDSSSQRKGHRDRTVQTMVQVEEQETIGTHLLTPEGVDGVHKFLSMYSQELAHLDSEVYRLDDEIIQSTEKMAVLRSQLAHDYDHEDSTVKITRKVSILLDSKANAEVELFLSYLVSGASWEPKYDIRAYLQEELVKVTYFGLIKQHTGEDWLDAKIFLSTSRPSSGGDIPTLNTRTVNFTPVTETKPNSKTAKVGEFIKKRIMDNEDAKESPGPDGQFASDAHGSSTGQSIKGKAEMVRDAAKDMVQGGQTPPTTTQGLLEKGKELARSVAETSTQDKLKAGGLSTSYEIARRSNIPSDNTEHKVTVAMFDLKPVFEHICVPSVVESAFLIAKMTNASPYLLLGGPTSVFVDNNFITKGTLETVSPAEEFECSLGIDAAVRVDYKPCEKYNEASGVFSKSPLTRYKQVIEIKNTHQRSILVQIEEQLPRSGDEKIKINLVAPHLPKEKERENKRDIDLPINLNDRNNIVWRHNIAAGGTEQFLLHYTIEKPKDSRDLMYETADFN